MKIGITADCSSGLEYFPHNHSIKITRTTINFKDEVFIDGIDINADEFYEKLSQTDIIPTTSAPTIGEILKNIDYYKQNGYTDVIHFPISFNLSSYGENLKNAITELIDGINFHVFNSKAATIIQGYIAYYAEILAKKNYDIETIFKECDKLRRNSQAYFIVDDLKYLVKNGRLSTTAGFIGNLARVKPILELNQNGSITTYEKVRTHNKAVKKLLEIVKNESKNYKKVIYIALHTKRKEDCLEIIQSLKKTQTNGLRFEHATITPTVGAHIGCGVLGVGRIVLDDLLEMI